MAKGQNPRRAKIHRTYTVAEAAALFCVHRNTVRSWIRRGLPVVRVDGLVLLLGSELRSFLERTLAAQKRKSPPGTLYCFRCREPRAPAAETVRIVSANGRTGNLGAECGHCRARMFRRISLSKLEVSGFSGVRVEAGSAEPSR